MSCGASVGFLTRYDEELREPLVWRQGSQASLRVARGSALRGPNKKGEVFRMGSIHGVGGNICPAAMGLR